VTGRKKQRPISAKVKKDIGYHKKIIDEYFDKKQEKKKSPTKSNQKKESPRMRKSPSQPNPIG